MSRYIKMEVRTLSCELNAIADWLSDGGQRMPGGMEGSTAVRLRRTVKYLNMLYENMCSEGFVCSGGDNCISDHK